MFGHGNTFLQCVNCDIDFDDIWVKVMTHPRSWTCKYYPDPTLQLQCKIYDRDTDFGHVCTVTLTLEI